MKQVAALQASMYQYDQVTNVMPQLSAEMSTLDWLYSVMNKGEGAMNAMNVNIPIRARAGGIDDGLPKGPNVPTIAVDGEGNVSLVHPNEMEADVRMDAPPRNVNVKRRLNFEEQEEDGAVGQTPRFGDMNAASMQSDEPRDPSEEEEFYDATEGDRASTSSARVIVTGNTYEQFLQELQAGNLNIIDNIDLADLNDKVSKKIAYAQIVQDAVELALWTQRSKKGRIE